MKVAGLVIKVEKIIIITVYLAKKDIICKIKKEIILTVIKIVIIIIILKTKLI